MLRAKLSATSAEDYVRGAAPAGPSGPPGKFDRAYAAGSKVLERAGESGLRLAQNPAMQQLQDFGNPTGGLMRQVGNWAVDRLEIGKGGPADLSTKTQANMAGLRAPGIEPSQVSLTPMGSGPEPVLPDTPTLEAQAGQPPRSAGGGGAGGAGGLGSLAGAHRDAQGNLIRSFNTEQDLVERRGELQEERTIGTTELQQIDAARKMRDIEVTKQHNDEAAAKHDAFIARNQQLADEIGSTKIDPQKVIADMGAGQKIGMMIGGMLSGFAGQGQQAISRLEDIISTGVKAQMANADGQRAKLSARQSIFQQMMAESGDRKVAENQTRALAWEATKQKMLADAERLGIPEMKVNAELARNAIDETKIAPLRVQLTGEALQYAQKQAAAGAAAQRAAEERRYQHMKDEREFALKVDSHNLEREKIVAKDKDDVNAETAKLGAALADPKLAGGRAAVEASKRRLGIAEDGTTMLDANGKPVVGSDKGLPGVGALADFREKIAGKPEGLMQAMPMAWVANKTIGLSQDERVARGDWDKVALAYQVQVTGSGGSEEQMKQIRSAFAGAKTPQEQRNAIAEADAVFRQIESRHKAGVSPKALATFEGRLKGVAPQMPGSVTVKQK